MKYTLSDVQTNLKHVGEVIKARGGISPVSLLGANHTLMFWVFAHGEDICREVENRRDVSVINAFWSLLVDSGIILTKAEKKEILDNFLND